MIKNYTSQVPASRSIKRIEDMLIVHGARNILKTYDDDGQLSGICFQLAVDGQVIPFKLPARIENIERLLNAQIKRPTNATYERIKAQAARTAWNCFRIGCIFR